MKHTEQDMRALIFSATQQVVAEIGLDRLSMQKIASVVGISPGTIYIHFKNKDELLTNLAENLIDSVNHKLAEGISLEHDYKEQYLRIWYNLWNFFIENKQVTLNLNQYKSLPAFYEKIKEREEEGNGAWTNFIKRAIKDNVIIDLSANVLFILSISSAAELAFHHISCDNDFDEETLNMVAERSWLAICKS